MPSLFYHTFRGLSSRGLVFLLALLLSHAAAHAQHDELLNALRNSPQLSRGTSLPVSQQELRVDAALLKLDPLGRLMSSSAAQAGKRGAYTLPMGNIASVVQVDGQPAVDVFIQLRTASDARGLARYGVELRAQTGTIAVARVPLDALRALAADPAVITVETSGRSRSLMETSRVEIRADQVHTGSGGLPRAYTGRGVVLGVIDSGIDFTHPDFAGTDGRSRIRYLVDLQQDGTAIEWTDEAINADPAQVTERDGNGGHGHGTHVAGTAAGSGRASAVQRGIAPEADIIFVKGIRDPDSNGGFSDADVVNGVAYIFEKAAALGKPAVINLSLGGHLGPHDGTSLYEQALDGLTGPGRIIVAAAGNEGNDFIHAGAALAAGQFYETLFGVEPDAPLGALDIWADPGTVGRVSLGVLAVTDNQLEYLGQLTPVETGQTTGDDFVPAVINGDTLGYYAIDALTTQDPNSGDANVHVLVSNNDDPNVHVENYLWALFIETSQPGRLDMWAPGGVELADQGVFTDAVDLPGNTEMTVGSPATAQSVISVGSYVTRTSWTDIDNVARVWTGLYEENPVIGAHSAFSSVGPTRDGRTLPDIAAPGERIASALSSHLTEGQGVQRGNIVVGGRYHLAQGTSMAAPHVAGVVALMLEADPTLTTAEVRTVFSETARTDAFTGTVRNNQFGTGKVDALAAVKKVAGSGGDPGGSIVQLRGFDPAGPQLVWTVQDDGGFVFGTNRYGDQAKATLFTLPGGQASAQLAEVGVYFGYKKAGTDGESYTIEVYNGTAASGPTGAVLFSQSYSFAGIQADADLQTNSTVTAHRFAAPVTVGSTFFVSVDFGTYDAAAITNAAIAATDRQGHRVAEVWEKAANDTWSNMSDEWFDGGTDGWYPWIEASIQTSTGTDTEQPTDLPLAFGLGANFPNPFHDRTTLQVSLPAPAEVELQVFDVLGRLVVTLAEEPMSSGTHDLTFDADGLPSGVYMARLRIGDFTQVRKMMLVR